MWPFKKKKKKRKLEFFEPCLRKDCKFYVIWGRVNDFFLYHAPYKDKKNWDRGFPDPIIFNMCYACIHFMRHNNYLKTTNDE